jgi:hypothetical protein
MTGNMLNFHVEPGAWPAGDQRDRAHGSISA